MSGMDNVAKVSWALMDTATQEYDNDQFNECRNTCLLLVNNAYTPYRVAIGALDLLSRCETNDHLARGYINQALTLCDQALAQSPGAAGIAEAKENLKTLLELRQDENVGDTEGSGPVQGEEGEEGEGSGKGEKTGEDGADEQTAA